MMKEERAHGSHIPDGRVVNLAAVHPDTGPLHEAWRRLQSLAAQAVDRRMSTEMSDLAVRIRKLHDGRHLQR